MTLQIITLVVLGLSLIINFLVLAVLASINNNVTYNMEELNDSIAIFAERLPERWVDMKEKPNVH